MRLVNTVDFGRLNRRGRAISSHHSSTTAYFLASTGDVYSWGLGTSGQLGDNSATTKSFPVLVVGNHKFTQLTSGVAHALALKVDGTCWAWGVTTSGALGDGTNANRSSPVSVLGSHSFTKIGAGSSFSTALKDDGSAWAWGLGTSGQLGDNTATGKSSPISVAGGHSFVQISSGTSHSIALKSDNGSAWTWGLGTSGQLGDNTLTTKSSPVSVVGEHSFITVYAGSSFSVATKADGSGWAWGLNTSAQLGDNTVTTKSSPVLVVGTYQLHSFSAVFAGTSHSAALKAGDAWGWGLNTSDQIGDGTATTKSSPVSVSTTISFSQINGGADHGLGLKNDGSGWSWGLNSTSQLGNNNTTNQTVPILIYGTYQMNSFTSVFRTGPAATRTFVSKADGTAWGWGANGNGELGDNTATTKSSPVAVAGNHIFSKMSSGTSFTLGLKTDGSGWAWGANTNGILGLDSAAAPNSPLDITGTLFLHSFIAISEGERTFVLKPDGSAWAWGDNTNSRLGDFSTTDQSSPVSVVGAHSFTKIATNAGGQHAIALKANGSVWTWGLNTNGQLGDGSITERSSPVSVIGAHSFIQIAILNSNTAGLKADGTVWTWGLGTSGQLGDNQVAASRSSPVSIVGAHSFIQIAGGANHFYALKADNGTIWSWGAGTNGALGDNTATSKSSPVSVVGAHSFTGIGPTGGAYTLAVKSDGAWTWGLGTSGQLGDNTLTSKSSPVSIIGAHVFTSIAGGSTHALGLKSTDGSTWAWGLGTSGQLGDNTLASKSSPVSVAGTHSFTSIAAGNVFSGAIKSNGSTWTWGNGASAQLGQNNLAGRSSPHIVTATLFLFSFIDLASAATHSVALNSGNGTAWAWGDNASGKLADNTTTNRSSPVSVVGAHSFDKIACGTTHSLALKSVDGSAWAWGVGTSGVLGDNTTTTRSSPTSVIGAHSFDYLVGGASHSAGLKANNGTVWTWGLNTSGQLGDGSTTPRSSPVSVAGAHSFTSIYANTTGTVARKADGTVWAWGLGTNGQLGDNTVTSKSSPVSVAGNVSYISIASGLNHTIAIKASDSSVWAWGINSNVELGDNSNGAKSSPQAVYGAFSFVSLSNIAAGGTHSLSIAANGTCFTWGDNTNGRLGDNTTTSRSSPVSVVGAHSFTSIAAGTGHSLGLKTDNGTCWAWGLATSGQLGDNTATSKSSPVSVAGAHSFSKIVAAVNFSAGLKSNDGSLWTWGINTNGQLGDGSLTTRSSPVSVLGAHSFTKIMLASSAASHLLALKSDGSLWAWGLNSIGQLGDGTVFDKSSPISVAGGHSFIQVSGGGVHTIALKADGQALVVGGNYSGQLGSVASLDNAMLLANVVLTNTLYSFASITGGNTQTVALKSNGTCWAWGLGTSGQLGDNTLTTKSSPTSVFGGHSFIQTQGSSLNSYGLRADGSCWAFGDGATLAQFDNRSPTSFGQATSYTAIACGGNSSYGIKSDGSVWGLGLNTSGELGDGTATTKSSPIFVIGSFILHSFTNVFAGQSCDHMLASKSDGSTWAWGFGTSGQLGDNTATNKSTPVIVVGAHSFASIAPGVIHSSAIKNTGEVWTWGSNASAQLGENTTLIRSSPISVLGPHTFTAISAGGNGSCTTALKADGSAWVWGLNGSGQIGDNSTTTRSVPASVSGAHSFASIVGGGSHTVALKSNNGTVWAWGLGTSGQLGDGTAVTKSSPVSVIGAHSFISIIARNVGSTALKSDGTVWSWGAAASGALGDNQTTTNRTSPVSVVGAHSFASIASGGTHTLALKSEDGSVWTWGLGTSGQLGDNTATSKSSPVSVVGNHSFTKIVAGTTCSAAIKADGTIWAWGLNTSNQLGDGTATTKSSPVAVFNQIKYHSFSKLGCGVSHGFALKSNDGSAWGWGFNSSGRLGDSSITTRSSPVSVVGAHSFDQITGNVNSIAIKANDGSAWSWGISTQGMLGDGTATAKSSPVSVLGAHSFIKVAASTGNQYGLRGDGTVWAWGLNTSGQLADGTGASKSSPVSVIGSHSFTDISADGVHVALLKSDGSAWGWGIGASGPIGDNTTTTRSSPVSVVGNHSFIKIAAGATHTLALKADGTVWGWGLNTGGQLGDFTLTSRSSPVLTVCGGYSYIAIAANSDRSTALRNDGAMFIWGDIGTELTDRSIPTSVARLIY